MLYIIVKGSISIALREVPGTVIIIMGGREWGKRENDRV